MMGLFYIIFLFESAFILYSVSAWLLEITSEMNQKVLPRDPTPTSCSWPFYLLYKTMEAATTPQPPAMAP